MLRSTLRAAAPIRRAAATLCSPLLGSILLALLVSACDSSAGKETTAEAPHPEEAPTLDPAGFNSHVANGTGAAHRQRGEAPQLAEQF